MTRTAHSLTCNGTTQILMPANVGRSYLRISVKDAPFVGRAVAGVSLDGAADAAEGGAGNLVVARNLPIELQQDAPFSAITIKGPAGLEIEAWEDSGGAERVDGWGFSVAVAPTVTAGAYSAGDIMGGLLEFDLVAPANDAIFFLQNVEINFLSAVTPSLVLHLFDADPASSAKADNAAYSLLAADAFKRICSLPFVTLNAYLTDHGTPNSYSLPDLSRVLKPVAGTRKIYGLLVDLTGVTLASTSDLQVRLSGTGA